MIHVNYLLPYCKITESDAGRIGPRCDKVCPYLWFGKRCLSNCYCSKVQCEPADGCLGILILDISSFFIITVRSVNKYLQKIYFLYLIDYCRVDQGANNAFTDISDKKYTTSSHREGSKRDIFFLI